MVTDRGRTRKRNIEVVVPSISRGARGSAVEVHGLFWRDAGSFACMHSSYHQPHHPPDHVTDLVGVHAEQTPRVVPQCI